MVHETNKFKGSTFLCRHADDPMLSKWFYSVVPPLCFSLIIVSFFHWMAMKLEISEKNIRQIKEDALKRLEGEGLVDTDEAVDVSSTTTAPVWSDADKDLGTESELRERKIGTNELTDKPSVEDSSSKKTKDD